MRFILDGTALILRTPRLWRYILQPLLAGALAFVAVTAGAYWLVVPGLNARIDHALHATGIWGGAVGFLTSGLYIGLLVLTSGFLYLTLASFFSAGLWEKLSFEIELMKTGNRIETKLPVPLIVKDSVARGMFAFAVTLLSLLLRMDVFRPPGHPVCRLPGTSRLHVFCLSQKRRHVPGADGRGPQTEGQVLIPAWRWSANPHPRRQCDHASVLSRRRNANGR